MATESYPQCGRRRVRSGFIRQQQSTANLKLSPIVASVFCVCVASYAAQDGESIASAAQAIARAEELTGLRMVPGPPRATLVKLKQDHTPFLGARNAGQPAWRVEYARSSPLPFSVFMEPVKGRLLYLTSSRTDWSSTGKSATEQLRSEGEVYSGYPEMNPKINFITALERIPARQAAEIEAVYVLHSRHGSKPNPVWIITLRGLPTFPAHGPHADTVPLSMRNHLRYVVDSTNGEMLFSTNTP